MLRRPPPGAKRTFPEDAFDACVAATRTTTCGAFPRCDDDAGTSYATCSATSGGDCYVAFGKALCGG
ncbi:MAG TPA: hypothetical protein VGH28_28345 [Polyangiaceae bacterium]|jgi:hypothetical protein